jgi:hypothetical protein
LKHVIERLLVRDPDKRARLDGGEIWDEEWMRPGLEGSVRRPQYHSAMTAHLHALPLVDGQEGGYRSPTSGKKDEFDEFEGELVDKNNISGVALREIDG